MQYQGKPATYVRDAVKTDAGYAEKKDMIVVALEDGSQKVISREVAEGKKPEEADEPKKRVAHGR